VKLNCVEKLLFRSDQNFAPFPWFPTIRIWSQKTKYMWVRDKYVSLNHSCK